MKRREVAESVARMDKISRYSWIALAVGFIGQMGNAFSIQAVAPLAPLFQPELGLTKTEVGFFSSAAFLGAWGVLLAAGSLTDRFGIRKMMSLGQLLSGACMLAMAAVGSFGQALTVLIAAGVGRGLTAPGVTKAVMEWFPPSARATAMGIKQAAVPVAGIITASTLPVLALAIGWRNAMATVGFLIIAGGVAVALLYRSPSYPGQAPPRKAALGAGLGEVLRNRNLWTISIISLMFVSVQLAATTYLALYFAEVVLVSTVPDEGTRVVAAGGYLAVCQAGGVLGRVFWGLVSDRVFRARRLPVLAIVGGFSAGISLLLANLSLAMPLWMLTALIFAYGATAVGWNGLNQALMVEVAGRKYAGTGVGLSLTLTQGGTVGGAPLFGFVVDMTGSYQAGWTFLAALAAAGTLAAILASGMEKQVD